jgi:predicted O-linked N-acetylglucosamine transferase (SPINDLY family)
MAVMSVEQALALGVEHHQAGRLGPAEAIYREILGQVPGHAGAMHLLGLVVWQGSGDVAAGEALIRRAIAAAPGEAVFHSNLSRLLWQTGRKAEAVAAQREAVRLAPRSPVEQYALGVALMRLKEPAAEGGNQREAEACYRGALSLKPDYPEAWNALGVLLMRQGKRGEAEVCFRRAVAVRPDHAEPWANLGDLYQGAGEHEQAIGCYRKSLQARPGNLSVLKGLGDALNALRYAHEALAVYQHIVTMEPASAASWNNLGTVLRSLDQLDGAREAFDRALELESDLAVAHSNLGMVHDLQGAHGEAIASARRAAELKPEDARLHSNLLYLLHFDPGCEVEELLREHRLWNVRHAGAGTVAGVVHRNGADPERRIRVGYVSPNFRNHAVGRFMVPVLEGHRQVRGIEDGEVEVICFSGVRPTDEDATTRRLRAAADGWHSIVGKSPEAVAALVRGEGIDLLVDLVMHMEGSQLPAFALKPAPVQVTYLAYCSTTGLEAMDYRLTDRLLDPEGDMVGRGGGRYVERSEYLESYWCYDPGADAAVVVNASPATARGSVTFGCLNNFSKVTEEALETWARVLLAVPGSRLLLHARPGSHRDRVQRFLAGRGVEAGRCAFVGQVPTAAYFSTYHEIDIALDPFPYAGGTTTCDALWMGVPVVTLAAAAGKPAVGRAGVSILTHAGHPEWIARTREEYVEKAVGLAEDVARLQAIRAALREQLRGSVLMDAARFARSLEAAYRRMWRAWCARQGGMA